MSSILTNSSAVVALQTLKSINSNLSKTQNEISTGKTINSAKDNAALWSIAKTMESDQDVASTIQKNLNVAAETVATARTGAEDVLDKLSSIKKLMASANRSDADFAKIQTDINELKDGITATIAGTQANGVNLLSTNGVNGAATYTVLGSLDRSGTTVTASSITVTSVDLEANLDLASLTAITDQATATTALGEIDALITIAQDGATALGAKGSRIEAQSKFVGKLADSLKLGVSALVDADMEESSARLQALQTQQQLGIQALSIANQAPSSILSLFRG
ncbi:flagellin [Paracoccus limosus]|jgi:flagellin|uniref:Flagellin n=1 Tax=Paracoccus limosus TaxID=913252 RepID=A0A844GYW5_9RHOB|nr:flagellin [Paracoccus limosus]MTH32985.1 flagellin [Paracoccus limosus]